jgi:hypothetical protein
MYFHLSYFHFQKTGPFSISQKDYNTMMGKKKMNKMYDPCMIDQNMYLVT